MSQEYVDDELIKLVRQEYDRVVNDLEPRKEELTPDEIKRLLDGSLIAFQGRYQTNIVEEGGVPQLIIKIDYEDKDDEYIKFECTRLQSIINYVNEKSLAEAQEALEDKANAGVGEYTLDESDNLFLIGFENDNPNGENDEELDGGQVEDVEDPQVDALAVACQYQVIKTDDMSLETKRVQMTPDQISKFNRAPEVQLTTTTYARYDNSTFTYYEDEMYGFRINGQMYYIRVADWTNGGTYTIVWKPAKEENGENQKEDAYPELAIGILDNVASEYARDQRAASIGEVIEFIAQNPRRFKEYYERKAGKSDSCGRFPTENLYRTMYAMLIMKKESELAAEQEVGVPVDGRTQLGDLLGKAVEARTNLQKAKDLLIGQSLEEKEGKEETK